MASKRKWDDNTAKPPVDDTSCGYLHSISPVKRSKLNNQYFEGQLQTGEDTFKRLVCFDPQKHASFTGAQSARTPVKLSNISHTPSKFDASREDIMINNRSFLTVTKCLTFRHSTPISEKDVTVSIADIIEKIPERNKVSLCAKILSSREPSTLEVRGQPMEKQELTIADHTGCISLTTWNKQVNTLKVSQSYQLNNLSTRHFNNVKSVTTTVATQIIPTKDLDIEDHILELQSTCSNTTLTGNFSSIMVIATKACSACNRKTPDLIDTKFYRCTNCCMRQRSDSMIQSLSASGVFNNGQKLQIYNSVLTTFLSSQDKKDILTTTSASEQLEEFLLNLDSVTVTFSADSVITNMDIPLTTTTKTSKSSPVPRLLASSLASTSLPHITVASPPQPPCHTSTDSLSQSDDENNI